MPIALRLAGAALIAASMLLTACSTSIGSLPRKSQTFVVLNHMCNPDRCGHHAGRAIDWSLMAATSLCPTTLGLQDGSAVVSWNNWRDDGEPVPNCYWPRAVKAEYIARHRVYWYVDGGVHYMAPKRDEAGTWVCPYGPYGCQIGIPPDRILRRRDLKPVPQGLG